MERIGETEEFPDNVPGMPDGSRKFAKPAAALGVLATMASIWWFALRPRRKVKTDSVTDDTAESAGRDDDR